MEKEVVDISDISEDEWRELRARAYKGNDDSSIMFGEIDGAVIAISPKEGRALGHLMLSNHNLTSIQLSSCKCDSDTTTTIMNAIQSNPSISRIHLRYCSFGHDVSLTLGNHLTSNTSIANLKIDHCYISTEGATILGRALQSNSSLTYLYLFDYNEEIGIEATTAITNSLHSNYTLPPL